MSAQLLGPTPLHTVVATKVSADQQISLSSLGTVTAVETASATGYTLSLVDSAGAGATIPVMSIASSGGPPITAATASYSVPVTHTAALQCGTGTLVAGTLAVANAAVTAGSIILVQQTGAAVNATEALSVTAGAGTFTVNGPAASTATFNWFVAKY